MISKKALKQILSYGRSKEKQLKKHFTLKHEWEYYDPYRTLKNNTQIGDNFPLFHGLF